MPLVDADAIRQQFEAWPEAARAALPSDRVGSLTPGVVLEPADVAMAGAMLAAADAARLAVLPRGAGTKLAWGSRPRRLDVVLSTHRLQGGIDHEAGDLVATVPAAAPLHSVNIRLARAGQWIPLDPLGSRDATIGGIVAAHDSGPRRHKHGTPRDLLIGVEFILANGRAAKAGGRVVKNVAGYDLGRLMCGSHGTLALITSATFKLSPLPAASRTVRAGWHRPNAEPNPDPRRALQHVLAELAIAPLTPSAVDLLWPDPRLLVRVESTPAAAMRQADAVAAICARHGAFIEMLQQDDEVNAWHEADARIWSGPETAAIAKIATLPSALLPLLASLEQTAQRCGLEIRGVAHAAIGVGYVRASGRASDLLTGLQEFRRAAGSHRGSLVLLAAPDEVRGGFDAWGDVGDGADLMRAVKAQFDPHGTLSPGRGAGGF